MTDPSSNFGPPPPTARPASALAAVLVLVLVFVVGVVVGQSGSLNVGVLPQPTPTASPGNQVAAPSNFDLFWQALGVIRQNFVGRSDITDEQITYGAIRGLVEALGDTGHSVFLTPEAVQAQNESLNGSVVGIGVLLGERDDRVIVISVISGGPADEAGMRTGDAIIAVDGQPTAGLAAAEVAPKVRGEAGTTVSVTVERPSTGERIDFDIVREELHFPAASWTMVPGTKIGLLRLVQFSTGSAAELQDVRDQAIAAGATSLILDLRSNPGGYVPEAINTASLFLTDRTVYVRELASGQRIPVTTNAAVPATDLPLVVLTDQGTASSAEIVSAAIKSNDRGELVGDITFGTGTVLKEFDLPGGSAIRLAVERWLTPDGDLIFGKGIEPTVPVIEPMDEIPLEPTDVADLTPAEVSALPDTQLKKAIDLLEGN